MKLRGAFLIISCLCLLSCRAAWKRESPTPPPWSLAFQPATYVSPIRFEKGPYPNLFAPTSYAVWVGPEVIALKQDKAEEEGKDIDPELEAEAVDIVENYVVVECHMESMFGDMSIAYDVVGFAGIDVYMRMPDGRTIRPSQQVIGSPLREEQKEALRLFGRTNIVVFPKRPLWIEPDPRVASPLVELVMEGYGSTFRFEWPLASDVTAEPWVPTSQEAAQALRLGLTSLYGGIRELVHVFD